MIERPPRYAQYTLMELLEAITGLDRNAYPERADAILAEIEKRYPAAWALLGEKLRTALTRDEDILLKNCVDALPAEILMAAGSGAGADESRNYEEMPDYESYSAAELLQALNGLDSSQYPDRRDRILEHICRRFPDSLDEARRILEADNQ